MIVSMFDATDVGAAGRATVAKSKRNSQRRWSHHQGEVEDEDLRELHGRTAESIKQVDKRSKSGRNLARRWVFG